MASQEMLKWSGSTKPKRILDVGCGFGGTSRHLAAKFPDAQVTGKLLQHIVRGVAWFVCCMWPAAGSPKLPTTTGLGKHLRWVAWHAGANRCVLIATGITLSPKQVERGTELARERGLTNVEFKVNQMIFAYVSDSPSMSASAIPDQ